MNNTLQNILEKKCNFKESIDINLVLSFGMKDIAEKRKKTMYKLVEFPNKVKSKRKLFVFCDEVEVKNKFDNLTFTPYEITKINKKTFKNVDCVFSLSSSMSRFSSVHKLLGFKKLSPKENEGTLFKKKTDLIDNISKFLSGNQQRISFNLLKKTCVLNCSIGNNGMNKKEIEENLSFLIDYIKSSSIKEYFGLKKDIKILSNKISSTQFRSVI